MKSLRKRVFSAALACVLLVSATVSLNASAASASNMTDIPSGSWYESAVRYCLNNNYMNGESETKFNPNGTVSRAQMVQVLYNLEGQPGYTSGHTPFEDITPGSWYYNAVRWSEENGIASGTSATTFDPDAPVTREQVATFFANLRQVQEQLFRRSERFEQVFRPEQDFRPGLRRIFPGP